MTVSNLYAMKNYSEHPVGLWPIDDDLSYISLIGEADRVLTTWSSAATIAEYTSFNADQIPDPLFKSDKTFKVNGAYSTEIIGGTTYYCYKIKSPYIFNFLSDLNADQKVFSINAYIYHRMPAAYYEIGYMYNDGIKDVVFTEEISAGMANEWVRIGRTFDPYLFNTDAQIYIKVFFTLDTDIDFLINGLSVGQWSETKSHASLGIYPEQIDINTGIPACLGQNVFGIELHEYGHGSDTAYVLVQDNRLLAENGGIPLVYGSDSITTLVPSSDSGIKLPSLVVPGKGFLNSYGRFVDYTLEAWVRVDNTSTESRRIVGPLASEDGIYVRGNTMSLVIGDSHKSFYIGQWYRPMLLHFTLRDGEAALMINGDRVINMPYSQNTAVLPQSASHNEDWIGFYAWSDVRIFEVDTISIFSYVVPSDVAKRRFVRGQGVDSPELINSAHLGTSHMVDFAYAKYTTNCSYPESARWDAGVTDNLVASKFSLSAPEYQLPILVSGNRSMQSILYRSELAWDKTGLTFITFADDVAVDPTYFFFEDINVISGVERLFYAVFSDDGSEQGPLFVFMHKQNGIQLRADIDNGVVTYKFNNQVIKTMNVIGTYTVGFDFSQVNKDIADFIANTEMVELYVGGDKLTSFNGNIYRIGFCSPENSQGLNAVLDEGIIESALDAKSYVASYTVAPIFAFGKYYLDILVSGMWTETYPLGYFADDGHIDFLQFNFSALPDIVSAHVMFSGIGSKIPAMRSTVEAVDETGVLDLSKSTTYRSAAFRIKNNTVLIPPDTNLNDLVMTLILSVKINGIATDVFKLRDMSIASVANVTDLFMEMNGTHGSTMAPYTKIGNYYTNEVDKPWLIYKQSTPYLYLTNDSGVQPLSSIKQNDEAGLWVSINKNRSSDFKMSALQLWLKYSEETVPEEPVELFSVRSKDQWIRFMCVDDGTGQRARVYSIDGYTGEDYVWVSFHQDGKDVLLPYIQNDHWTALGIDFAPMLDFSYSAGAICLIHGCVFNNIVFYQTSSLHEQYDYIYRNWAEVKNDGTNNLTWDYWKSQYGEAGATWNDVAKTMTISHGLSIDGIYKTYVGTNRFVVDSDSSLRIGQGHTTVISNKITTHPEGGFTSIALTNAPNWLTLTKNPY